MAAILEEEHVRVLVVSHINGAVARVNQLCEYVIQNMSVDVVLICGGFLPSTTSSAQTHAAAETIAATEGDITSLIYRLEMIVCRVLYVPGPHDPLSLKRKYARKSNRHVLPRLTPFSTNCDGTRNSLHGETLAIYRMKNEMHLHLIVEGSAEIALENSDTYEAELAVKSRLQASKEKETSMPGNAHVVCRINSSDVMEGAVEWINASHIQLTPGTMASWLHSCCSYK